MQKDINRQDLLTQPRIIGITIVIVFLVLTGIISNLEDKRNKNKLRSDITNQLSQINAKLENEINRHFFLTRGLIAYIAQNPEIDIDTFNGMSNEILQNGMHIRRIGLAQDNILTFVYPLEGNTQIIGLDYRENTQKWPAILKMIADQTTIFDGPIDSVQGGKTFISRSPIFISQPDVNKSKYWGFINTVIQIDTLFYDTGLIELGESLRIAMHKNDGNGSEGALFFGDYELHKPDAVKLNIKVPGGSWVLSVEPIQGWNESSPNQFILWIIGSVLAIMFGWFVMYRLEVSAKHKLQLETALKYAHSANKAKSDFVANMSHEIRTPLNPIISLTYLALKDDLPAQTRNYLNEIQSSSQLLLKIIDNVLDFSKIEAGKMTIEILPFSLDKFLTKFSRLYTDQAQEKNLSFSTQLPQELPSYIVGDAMRLEQVLGYLINNAIKFTRNGSIALSVNVIDQNEDQVGLSFNIVDTGIGMTQEQIQGLFQEFNQSDSSMTREYGGTGLGLSICRKLIHLMGGEIFVESAPDKGSQFTFNLNFDLASEEMVSEIRSKYSLPAQQLPYYQDKSVLLVEDNLTNQVVVQKLLKGTGLKVYVANNGQEAVFMSLARRYDIILMDIQMPVMDGYQAVKVIRQKKSYKNIPIIAMTAHALIEDRKKSLDVGMSAHVSKPINPELFYKTLIHWLPTSETAPYLSINTIKDLWPLYDLPGIDTTVGLKKFLQDQELYQKVLLEFHKDHKNDAESIDYGLKNNDIGKAKNLAHTIKGAAGHLGAIKLYQATVQLEAGFNNAEILDESLHEFQLALEEVMIGIANLEEKYSHPMANVKSENELNKAEIMTLIKEFSDKLNQASPQASELVPQLSLALGKEHEEAIKDLQEMVDTFDFDEGLNILKQIKKSIN